MLPELALVTVLVVLNAVFAGSEIALVSLREGQLRRLEAESSRGALVARLARDPNRFLATIQIGITLAGFLASAAAAVSLAEPLREPLAFLGGAAEPVAVVVVTLVLAYATLVLGELAPKRVAMQRAEGWALAAARPLSAMAGLMRPAVWLLSRSADLVVRLLGADPSRQREAVTDEEVRDLVAAQTAFTAKQRLIIEGAFEVAERRLAEVLRPRPDVFVLDADRPARDGLAALAASGHSRAPVAPGANLDDVVGVVHLRDLLDGGDRPIGELAAPVPALAESALVLDALHELQARRAQLAVVVDEHGAADGIVTVEDLVEELVGEIQDETDRDVLGVDHAPGGSLILPGRFPVHDLVDVGIVGVPDGPYTTVAGFILDRLDRLPDRPGDRAEVNGWVLQVLAVDHHAITKVRATPSPGPAPARQFAGAGRASSSARAR